MTALHGRGEDVEGELRWLGVKYGVSIGRRAPMHRIHADCLREIAEAGLVPVIFIGSTNGPDSPLYDPVRNPMTVEQQKEQLKTSLPGYYDEKFVLTLDDYGDGKKWFEELFRLTDNALDGLAAVHYRVKAADAKAADCAIRPLSAYMENFVAHGMVAWESRNADPADDNINASDIRRFDLERLTAAQKSVMVSPDFVVALARKARAENPDAALLEQAGVPLTVFDLTLDRFRREAGISTAAIFAAAQTKDIDGMAAAGLALHRAKYFPEPKKPAFAGRQP